jgi:hypothetical protein
MQKIGFDLWKNSMSFLIDDEFDRTFLGGVRELADFIVDSRHDLQEAETLNDLLTNVEHEISSVMRLKSLVSIIGLSEERLKRVVSLVRFKFFQENFQTEWSVDVIDRKIQTNSDFRELLIEFFINGRNSRIGAYIPLYYMRNFRLLEDDFMDSLANTSYVERILNDSEVNDKYSNGIGAHVEKIIEKRLIKYKEEINDSLVYEVQRELPLLNKNIDFLIPSVANPIILIESSYNITTGSGQSKRADQLVDMYGIIRRYNANRRTNKMIMVNFCDGFGWVGRQNDLRRIYESSDFVFNQANMEQLDLILNEYYAD